jgi:hypothetical protein
MVHLYYFSISGFQRHEIPFPQTVRSLRQLEEQQTYKIVRAKEMGNGNILLFLKGFGNDEEFMSLLFQDLVPKFRKAMQLNNGEAAGLKLKYYGYTNFYGGNPIIGISTKGLHDISCERQTVCRRPRYLYEK